MGRKLDALFGKKFKGNKLRSLLSLAISRIAILKNVRQVKCTQARSDVVQLLELGHHEQALIRVELVIKEQNMLDVLQIAEGYCSLLVERIHVIEQERECPEELKEAISSLLFASSRLGEFPELIEIRSALASKYGKDLVARSVELRNSCGVNPRMVQKLSTRQPGLESRMTILKDIAAEKDILLKLDEGSSSHGETLGMASKLGESTSAGPSKLEADLESSSSEIPSAYGPSDSMKARKKYKDVADAAQEAFRSAANAAEAARAALELSRSDSGSHDGKGKPNMRRSRSSDTRDQEAEQKDDPAECRRSASAMSTDSDDAIVEMPASFREQNPVELLEKDVVIYDSDEDSRAVGSVTKSRKVMEAVQGDKRHISARTRQLRGY